MEGGQGIWRFALIALAAVVAGAGMGVLLGGANSDPFETVVETVTAERHTVTKTETETVTKTTTETVTETEGIPSSTSGTTGVGDDDADGDNCSDSYVGACLDPWQGYNDVECGDITDQDFTSTGEDPYGLDRDLDGVACESH
jgi:hypothetical protein